MMKMLIIASHLSKVSRYLCQALINNVYFFIFDNYHALWWDFRLSSGLTTHQTLWVILSRLPEKGRREIEEIVEEMKERDRGERKMIHESEETEEIKTFPLYPYQLQG